MNSNKKKKGKYTIGPHGEIYNNQPEFSERTKRLMEAVLMKEALNDAFNEIGDDEEENTDEDKGTPEGTD